MSILHNFEDFSIPSLSSFAFWSRPWISNPILKFMKYFIFQFDLIYSQVGIGIPMFNVTRWTGLFKSENGLKISFSLVSFSTSYAFGKINLIYGAAFWILYSLNASSQLDLEIKSKIKRSTDLIHLTQHRQDHAKKLTRKDRFNIFLFSQLYSQTQLTLAVCLPLAGITAGPRLIF